jgi:hypothetical protein
MNMKTSFKRLAAILLLAITAIGITGAFDPPKAEAQTTPSINQYGAITLLATSNIPANVTNVLSLTSNVLTATRFEEVAISISFNSLAADTANKHFFFKPSLEGSTNFATVNPYVFSIPANGTTQVTFTTNIFLGAVGYLSLDSIGNQSATVAVSNIVVKYATKPKFWR